MRGMSVLGCHRVLHLLLVRNHRRMAFIQALSYRGKIEETVSSEIGGNGTAQSVTWKEDIRYQIRVFQLRPPSSQALYDHTCIDPI